MTGEREHERQGAWVDGCRIAALSATEDHPLRQRASE